PPTHMLSGVKGRRARLAWVTGRSTRTRRCDSRSKLVIRNERHGLDLVCGECPADAVTRMNPELIREKGQSLPSQVTTLGAYDRLPRCSLNRLRSHQSSQHQSAAEHGWKPNR